MDNLTALTRWVPSTTRLPDLGAIVIVYRHGGINGSSVHFAQRRHKSGTRDEWEWLDFSRVGYWGISVDGSAISHWMDLPAPPEIEPSTERHDAAPANQRKERDQ